MTRGKVVLVPFPFDDLSGTKLRPAVCLTEPEGEHRHVVLAFITSHLADSALPSDIELPTTHPDFAASGLRVPSRLRLHRLLTVTTRIIQRELGRLGPLLEAEIAARLQGLFQLPYPGLSTTHEHLWTLVKKLPSDFEPYGQRDREEDEGLDCSCGCRYFHPLAGQRGYDWGICTSPRSPRAGLLTFEHMGCKEFEAEPAS
jgi:mRNA interferase MazF